MLIFERNLWVPEIDPLSAMFFYFAGRMFYVYILKRNNGLLYTGYTADLKHRLSGHQAGKSAFPSGEDILQKNGERSTSQNIRMEK